jgi:hypothetical protein
MLARLPHVRRVENEYNINAQPLGKNGLPSHAPPKARSLGISVLNNDGSIDGEFSDQDRLTAIDGRLANPGRANEIMVSSIVAQSLGLHVGDVVPIGFYTNVQTTLPGYGTGSARFTAKPPLRMDMKLIGIVAFNNQVVLDSLDQTGTAQIVYTPTLTRRLAQCCVTSTTSFLQLDHGTGDVSTVEREIEKVAGPSGPVLFGVKSNTGVAEQAIKPESIAIGVFGAIAALAALLIGGQTISRQLRSGADAVGIGTVVGIPLGIVLGRFLWDLFAHDIDSVPVPTVPGWPILLIAVGAFVLANIVATLPGRMAANTPTALLLRAE